MLWALALGAGVASATAPSEPLSPDTPIACGKCSDWNAAQRPFRVYGNTYYVGVHGLASVLVVSPAGSILLDGDLPQSAPLIEANIRALGFRVEDIRWIVNSHEHFDHAGGIAALARDSGAQVAASAAGARVLEAGRPGADDPQLGFGDAMRFPPVPKVHAVADGETLRVGSIALTAHLTPGHTPGSTSWTWKSCQGKRCLDVVYADSLNSISAPGFRFLGDADHPDIVPEFERSIERIAALPCDIVLSVHPDMTGTLDKLERRGKAPSPDPFIDQSACRRYAEEAHTRLAKRVEEERAGQSTP